MKEFVLGIDIGGTSAKFGLVNRTGDVFHEGAVTTVDTTSVDQVLRPISDQVKAVLDAHSDYRIIGAGVGAPNGNYYTGRIEHAPNLKWGSRVDFSAEFKKYFDFPVVLTNDANAAAIGEKVFGGGKDMKDFVVFTLGTGLGSGIMVDGKVVYGFSGFAGELGHITVNPKGRYCACGRRGCLETYVSATGIKRTVYKMLADYTNDSVLRGVSYDELTAKMITEAAQNNDFIAIKAFEYTGKILGIKLADTVVHTSPEAIFLFGGLVNAGKYLFEPAVKHMEKNLMKAFKGTVKLLPSALMDKNAAVLGAAALAWNESDE
ncbi:MAG: ROK family protein [Cyclobacteriaceae bacterium]